MLDTAPWYGHGISEIVVGYALDTILADDNGMEIKDKYDDKNKTVSGIKKDLDNPILSEPNKRIRYGTLPRSHLVLNTKVGRYEADPLHQFDFSYSTTIKSVHRSLERMNCGFIDVLQLHDPEFSPDMSVLMEETIPALIECRRRGWNS